MDYWITKILHFILFTNVCSQRFFNTMPPPVNTNFTCRGRDTGFYADVETNCRVYHTCDENGNKFTYYCPAETAFRQEALVCDHAHLVDCANGRRISRIDESTERSFQNTGQNVRNDGRYSPSSSSGDSSRSQDEKVGEQERKDSFQPGSSNSALTRSFRIMQEPRSQFLAPKSPNGQQATFVLSSSVFLRDRANFKNNPLVFRDNRVATDILKNPNNSEQPLDGGSSKKEESREGYSRIFSPLISTTTRRPFGADFRAKDYFRNRMVFPSSTFDKEEQSTEAYSSKFLSTTTKRPFVTFGEDYRVKVNPADNQNTAKFKLSYENQAGSSRSLITRGELDNEKMSSNKQPPSGSQSDEKRLRDKKIEINDDFRAPSTITEKEFKSQSPEKNNEGVGQFFETLPRDSVVFKDRERLNKNTKELKISIHERPPFFNENGNFPYSETLRSMQAIAANNYSIFSSTTTSSPTTIAGTEFPVHPFAGTFSPLGPNELDDDPYYPKRSTTTEVYYKLSNLGGEEKKPLRFSTKRPWPGSLNFDIPEVLPDLNTLDDLVDRRKFFYIPRNKAT